MGESKLGVILVSLRTTDGLRTVRLLTADGPPLVSVNRGRSAFSSADGPPLADFSDLVQIDMLQCGLTQLIA